MSNTEFYITPSGDIMIHDNNGIRQLKEGDRKFISFMLEKIQEFYPDALKALSKLFENKMANIPHYEFCIVRRFIKCNWGNFDSIMDFDQFGTFNFEEVICPLRGECAVEGIICKPKFNSKLSDRELEIMGYFYDGISSEEIADKVCLSVETIRTHKRNAFRRVNVHSLQEFFLYAKKHNLFEN